ncbi:MAG: glycosyltransferase family 4 protein [Clostridiaceae bacterium]|nr:glycosyltransferase family 4 protein [Clostridiaceae bacterium]
MSIFIASEFRCTIFEGKYYLAPKAFTIYKRYADVFGDVVLCCRFEKKDKLMKGYKEATFVKKTVPINSLYEVMLGKYKDIMTKEIKNCDLVIARIPSMIAYRAADYAKKIGVPYLAELMGDAWDSYWNHDMFGKCVAPYMDWKMKGVAWQANYSVYVTEKYLQTRYPCKNKGINASNVVIKNIDDSVLKERLKKITKMDKGKISMMTTAAVDTRAKGQQFVIKAIKGLKEQGVEVTYYLAGGGDQSFLRKIALNEGVKDNVVFLGELTRDEVCKYLDYVDVYVQPSLQEGLPRSVIEAMSRGCPCIGSRTAGTPELIEDKFIFNRSSVKAIESSVIKLLSADLNEVAERNFNFSKRYTEEILNERRNEYFYKIREKIKNNTI